ncbi:glycosyltransferase family 2 protein, partial [Pluralibacter gergoviae]|uniref:glycosyltransferase family 2 protein n=1 Tax=Pluralibacter gergoviae TaxID=61647 RepID=UPI00190D8093
MKIKEKVSVVIPYYNDSQVFERCLMSVLTQTESPYEVIIIDDNSNDSDEVQNMLKKYVKNNIKYIRNEFNKNAAYSRNLGVCVSEGSVIAFIDADDYWKSTHLENALNILMTKDVDFVYSNVIEVDAFGDELKRKVNDIRLLENPYDIILESPPQTGSFVFYKNKMGSIKFNERLRRHQ